MAAMDRVRSVVVRVYTVLCERDEHVAIRQTNVPNYTSGKTFIKSNNA